METHFCDRLRSCDRDRRRSQKIEPCSISCDRLRSSAIVCDRLRSIAIVRSYGNQSSAICDRKVSHNIWIPTHDSTLLSNKTRISVCSNRLFVVNMAGDGQGNVARYECVYHRNSRDFKDKNKKVNCWEKIGEKFNLSAAEVKFRLRRRFQSTYCSQTIKYKSEVKVGSWNSWELCLSAPVILALPLTEMQEKVGSAIVGDRLRLYGNNSLCDRLRSTICDPRSSAIVCDHMETSLNSTDRENEVSKIFIISQVCVWGAQERFLVTRNGFKFLTHLESKTSQFEIVFKPLEYKKCFKFLLAIKVKNSWR